MKYDFNKLQENQRICRININKVLNTDYGGNTLTGFPDKDFRQKREPKVSPEGIITDKQTHTL